jgi:hypothetical protein
MTCLAYTESEIIQGDLGRKVNILGAGNTGYCEEKVHMNTCLIMNGYRD